MNISENIRWIMRADAPWFYVTNRSYRAQIQKADPRKIYNASGRAGIVYNFLEDAYEKVTADGYVVTGIAGEMWPIGKQALRKYRIDPENITDEAQSVDTVPLDTVYAAIQIPVGIEFTLETDYGERALLKGNRPEIGHAAGDYVLTAAGLVGGVYLPDFTDSGRIINGVIFELLYQRLEE